VGLGLPAYCAGPVLAWILGNVKGARERAEAGDLLMGTMDTWTLWNLTGGVNGGVHATDVTNASRTMLMNIDTLDWNPEICADMGIPVSMLPEIRPSSGVFGYGRKNGLLVDTPITGIPGDQHAAPTPPRSAQPQPARDNLRRRLHPRQGGQALLHRLALVHHERCPD